MFLGILCSVLRPRGAFYCSHFLEMWFLSHLYVYSITWSKRTLLDAKRVRNLFPRVFFLFWGSVCSIIWHRSGRISRLYETDRMREVRSKVVLVIFLKV